MNPHQMLPALALALVAGVAFGQAPEGEIQRHLLERQQLQDDVQQRLRQSNELTRPGMGFEQRQDIQRRHFEALQRQQQINESRIRRHEALEQVLREAEPQQRAAQFGLEKQGYERVLLPGSGAPPSP